MYKSHTLFIILRIYHFEEITSKVRLLYYLIKKIIDALEKARKDERVIEMTTAMSQWAEELKLYGEQRGFQQGELKKTITAINNGIKDDVMPSIISAMLSVSHDFVRYVESYFKANSGKTDEENVNALVEKVMSGEISTK